MQDHATSITKDAIPFRDRLGEAIVGGGFAMEDHWVWCGSPARGEDGRFHLFASVWSRALPFAPNWVTNSRIVRAVADRPEGPYALADEVLPPRGKAFWDGRMTHNPTIARCHERWLLFYTGTTYAFDPPATRATDEEYRTARLNQRVGVAIANHIHGPWQRLDAPILSPRPDKWDALITTNPSACITPEGKILLVYKSIDRERGGPLRLGVALAAKPTGPYERLTDTPLFGAGAANNYSVEDPFIWHNGTCYEAIFKDMTGEICGEHHAGVHATSTDGVTWHIASQPQAYSRTIRWTDGHTSTQGQLERPQLLLQNGEPTHLFAATGDGPGGFHNMTRTWNLVIELTPPKNHKPNPPQ